MAEPSKSAAMMDDGELATSESVSGGQTDGVEKRGLVRELRPHQVFMFSIACAIGTGLVIGTGSALAHGGPGSVLISYIMVGAAVFFVMTGLGEMAAFAPMNKGFGGYATRMVDPAFGFATGWNYFFKYCIALPTNLTAAGLVVQYWAPDLNISIWVTVFAAVVIFVNLLHVSNVGETEFWLSLIKVIVMTTLIITCFVIAMGGGPNHHRTGFTYWRSPGAFAEYLASGAKGRFLGWWASMAAACFAYTGTEVVGMTFGEIPNPRKNIPRAVKQTFWRIVCFYVLSVLVLGMAVPYNSDDLLDATKKSTSAAASPFVVAINLAGIPVLPDLINASLLVFTLSAASTDIYCASRSLYGLARDGQAPRIFGKTLKNGVPVWAVCLPSCFSALGYLNANKSGATVFTDLVSLVTVFGVLNWFAILTSYLSFRRAIKAQEIAPDALPFRGYLQPYGTYYAMFISCIVVIFSGYNAFIPHFQKDVFVLKYLGVIIFIVNVIWWKFFKKTRWLKPFEVDLVTGRQEFEKTDAAAAAEWQKSLLQRLHLRK